MPGYGMPKDKKGLLPWSHVTGRMAEAAGWSDLSGTRRKDKPWLEGMPRLIFVSDMSDALSNSVPFPYLRDEAMLFSPALAALYATLRAYGVLTWQLEMNTILPPPPRSTMWRAASWAIWNPPVSVPSITRAKVSGS